MAYLLEKDPLNGEGGGKTTTISRKEADELTVRMLHANRLYILTDNLLNQLLCYRTPQLDDETLRMFDNYIRYVERMRNAIKIEFLNRKKEVLDNINKNIEF